MPSKRIPLPMFRTILLATDLSERSLDVFRVACSLASEEATRLIVLHVVEPIPISEQPIGFSQFEVPVPSMEGPGGRAALLKELEELFVPTEAIPVEHRVSYGRAADSILNIAKETGSDLIVMGTHGRSGLDRLLLGSVAEAVMRRAHCPVLTVGSEPGDRGSEAGIGRKPLGMILHPTDFSANSDAALAVARLIARDHGAHLLLLHVVELETIPAAVSEMLTDIEIGREGLAEVCARVDGPDLKYAARTELRRGDPVTEIVDSARELQPDLIVIGSQGRTGLGRLLMGSVAEGVMRGAGCPVLTVKVPTHHAAAEAPAHAAARAQKSF